MGTAAPVLSVVCPVYQGAVTLPRLLNEIQEHCDKAGIIWEAVLVDDGSTDNSWNVIRELTGQYPVTGLKQAANYGQHYAIHAGLRQAKGVWITVMDCDLQDDPSFIPHMLQEAERINRSLLAFRSTKQNDPYYVISSWLLNLLLTTLTLRYNHYRTGNFGIFSRSLIDRILTGPVINFYFPVAIRKNAGRLPCFKVVHGRRAGGSSTYNFSRQIGLAWKAILFALTRDSGSIPYQTETAIYGKFGE